MTENELKNIGEQFIRSGDLAEIREFISAHPHLSTHLLRSAAHPTADSAAIVQFLLEAGGDPNEAGREGGTALHTAASFNNIACTRLLLAAGADPNMPGDKSHFNSGTPLAYAAGFGYRRLVDLLLANGATIYNGYTAAAAGRLDLLKTYILPDGTLHPEADAAGPGVEEPAAAAARVAGSEGRFIQWWFGIACRNNQVAIARYLLGLGYDIPLSRAETSEYQGDEWDHVEPEIESRAIVGTLLRHMTLRGYDELAELLREHGAPMEPAE